MTPDQRFTLILTGIGLILTFLGFLFKQVFNAGRLTEQVKELAVDIKLLIEQKEKDHERFDARIRDIERRRPRG